MLNEKESDTITLLINCVVRMMTDSHYLKLNPPRFILLIFVHVIFVDWLPLGKCSNQQLGIPFSLTAELCDERDAGID